MINVCELFHTVHSKTVSINPIGETEKRSVFRETYWSLFLSKIPNTTGSNSGIHLSSEK
jgi:hypothetical protein